MRGLYTFGLITLVLGCVHTNAAVLDPSALYQKTCPDAVVVYTSPERVGKPYKEVALLNSKGQAGSTSEEGMVKSQRKKAAQLGANGLILTGIDEPKPGTKIIGAILGTGAERKGKAMAIYVPDDSAKTAATCSTSQSLRNNEAQPAAPPAAPAAAPVQVQPATAPTPAAPPGLVDAAPQGTNWIANGRTKTYYQVGCPEAARIAPADRLFYGSESSLKAAGFKRAQEC
jgi:hypothetical protein